MSTTKATGRPSKKGNPKTADLTGKMKNSEFHKLFVDELKDIYWAEKHLVNALPNMKNAATSFELDAASDKHTGETQTHIEILEQVFYFLEEKTVAKKCDAMDGLLREADSIIEDTDKGTITRDAGLLLAAQKMEHYEIATYGTLVTFANNIISCAIETDFGRRKTNRRNID